MALLPWYKWYQNDWLTSETRFDMTLAERGLYRDLLDIHYSEGSIPAREEKLRAMVGAPKGFARAWAHVRHFFEPDPTDPTRLINQKAVEVIANRLDSGEASRKNGALGGRPKGSGKKPDRLSSGSKKKPYARASESESESDIPPTPLIEDDGGWAPLFERWWDVYPRKIAKADARKAYSEIVVRGKVKPEHRADLKPFLHFADRNEQLMEATKRWAGEFATRDGDKVPYPATFLRRMDWLAVPEAAAPAKRKFLRSWES